MFTRISFGIFMNTYCYETLQSIISKNFKSQRDLAKQLHCSLGEINKSLKTLKSSSYLDKSLCLTSKAHDLIKNNKAERAIILAAGFGKRMVPINLDTPKGLLEVKGERLIERLIRQLNEAGIKEIYVVVGFKKEKFEYLIDKYKVQIIVNSEYATKDNLHSLYLALPYLANSYIVPSNVYFKENPFRKQEFYSWYLAVNAFDLKSDLRRNLKNDLVKANHLVRGNKLTGLAYISNNIAKECAAKVNQFMSHPRVDELSWEDSLFKKNKFILKAKLIDSSLVSIINTYEELRDVDNNSSQLNHEAIKTICEVFKIKEKEIENITVLKKGMTNRSFLFCVKGKRYIMRIPGEGTGQLINRAQEAEVYQTIKDHHLCDNIVYINPSNGYKITEYFESAKAVNAYNDRDVKKAMKVLRNFHNKKLKVTHTFDIFKQIEFYESLREGPSLYEDYEETKAHVYELKKFIDEHKKSFSLTHIDAVPDNFLFVKQNHKEAIKLIDWEYSGMQDNDVDIAMFCIYAMYDKKHIDKTIKAYYPEGIDINTKLKIYCYIAVCGFLWSNWCEYKHTLGVEFGEYGLKQYRYAKEFYRVFKEARK